ncbi:MAG: hypothetical protein AAF694_06800 [Bacteroidota bacterium]
MQEMTRERLLKLCNWDDLNFASFVIHSDFFEKEVEIAVRPAYDSRRRITDKMIACVNDFLALSQEHLPKVKELLYAHCELCFETTSYGVDIHEGETEEEATRREFEVHSAADAYRQVQVPKIGIDEKHDRYKNRYVELLFYPPWEQEHGCNIILQNGIPIDWQESMPHMGKYEQEDG